MATPHVESRHHFILTLALFVFVLAVFVAGYYYGKYRELVRAQADFLAHAFQASILNAVVATPDEVSDQLFAVNEENHQLQWRDDENGRRLKVAAWMSEASYKKYYADLVGDDTGATTPAGNPVVWVTLVPQVKQFCRALVESNNNGYDPTMRIKQYLGLAPERAYAQFVEMWVKPMDLLRPCPDPEINDTACALDFDIEHLPELDRIEDYPGFFNKLKKDSYHANGAPWTRLGYTYDWAGGGEAVGASEYMLMPEAHYLVEASYGTQTYCTLKN